MSWRFRFLNSSGWHSRWQAEDGVARNRVLRCRSLRSERRGSRCLHEGVKVSVMDFKRDAMILESAIRLIYLREERLHSSNRNQPTTTTSNLISGISPWTWKANMVVNHLAGVSLAPVNLFSHKIQFHAVKFSRFIASTFIFNWWSQKRKLWLSPYSFLPLISTETTFARDLWTQICFRKEILTENVRLIRIKSSFNQNPHRKVNWNTICLLLCSTVKSKLNTPFVSHVHIFYSPDPFQQRCLFFWSKINKETIELNRIQKAIVRFLIAANAVNVRINRLSA